jgi:hypothetical protein
MRRACTAVVVTLLGACEQYHVRLQPPAPTLTPDERIALFNAKEPAKLATTEISQDRGQTWEEASTSLFLADGTEVVSPEDLAPLVAPNSPTMRAARRSVAARKKHHILYAFTIAAMIGGLALTGAFQDEAPLGTPGYVGWLAFLVPPFIGYVGLHHYARAELAERRAAFRYYARDLGDRLNLCARGLQLVACEAPPAPASLPASGSAASAPIP